MNFKSVLTDLLADFRAKDIRYALIGGYAVGLWGVPRGTVDLDFLINREDLSKLDDTMSNLGYSIHHRSENVSQYTAKPTALGTIDFLHAFRSASTQMLLGAVEKTAFGTISVKVVRVEDLIGLKIQAMANNPDRWNIDFHDISELLRLHGRSLDWDLLSDYFVLFDQNRLLTQLKEQYQCA